VERVDIARRVARWRCPVLDGESVNLDEFIFGSVYGGRRGAHDFGDCSAAWPCLSVRVREAVEDGVEADRVRGDVGVDYPFGNYGEVFARFNFGHYWAETFSSN